MIASKYYPSLFEYQEIESGRKLQETAAEQHLREKSVHQQQECTQKPVFCCVQGVPQSRVYKQVQVPFPVGGGREDVYVPMGGSYQGQVLGSKLTRKLGVRALNISMIISFFYIDFFLSNSFYFCKALKYLQSLMFSYINK